MAVPVRNATNGSWHGGLRRPAGAELNDTVRQVAEDTSALVKAEVALAKAEFLHGAKAKGKGIGMLVAAAISAWLAVQGLLLVLGLALALVMPGWAAALIVSVLLLAAGGVAALLGRDFLRTPIGIETAKHNVEADVATARAQLARAREMASRSRDVDQQGAKEPSW